MDIETLRRALHARLMGIDGADTLIDEVEGKRPEARKAAVLVCLFEQEAEAHILFIRRAATLRSHSGEIAFPGGGVEVEDNTPIATALREAQEEIGLDPAHVEVLGILPLVFTVVSNYLIVPVVAVLPRGLGELNLQRSEVTEVIIASLEGLIDPQIMHIEEWTRGGETRSVYFYDYGPYRIWGATGRILNTFLTLVEKSRKSEIDP